VTINHHKKRRRFGGDFVDDVGVVVAEVVFFEGFLGTTDAEGTGIGRVEEKDGALKRGFSIIISAYKAGISVEFYIGILDIGNVNEDDSV